MSDGVKGIVPHRVPPNKPEVGRWAPLCFPWSPNLGHRIPASVQQATNKKPEFIYLNLTFSVINPSNTDHLLFMYTITSVMLMWQIWRSKNMWGSAKDTFHHQLVSISLSADVCVPVIFLWETSLQCSYYERALQADFKEV